MTTEIEKCATTIKTLEDARRQLIQNQTELAEERQRCSFEAHTGNAKARARLDKINADIATFASEFESIEAAIREASTRFETAKRAEAQAVDKAAALQLRAKAARFKELGEVLDDCFADFRSAAAEMQQVLDDIHHLGCASPTHQMFKVNADRAFKTAVMGTSFWTQDFPFLAPGERKSFRSLVAAWSGAIESNIAARLKEKKKEAA